MTDAKLRKDNRELAIARAEEAAKYHSLSCTYFQCGPWITFQGWQNGYANDGSLVVSRKRVDVQERGWKAASDAFVAAVNEWAQKKGAEQ